MQTKSIKKNGKALDLLPCLVLILCTVILLLRAFYSFCWSDESFYFSTAYRFYLGDSIFRHDWFPTQLSGIILLPFLALFIGITGGTAGILLYFRILYVLFSAGNAWLTFRILKKHTEKTVALLAAVCVLFYAHLNIATLSYYTISVQCFFSAMLLIYHFYQSESRGHLIAAGILYALSVLALPTMAAAYVLTLVLILLITLAGRLLPAGPLQKALKNARFQEVLLFSFIGILIPAILFFCYLLLNVPIGDFIANIPYVLSDDEHGTSLIYPMKKFFIGINEVYGVFAYAAYLLSIACFALQSLLKRAPWRQIVFFSDLALFIACFIKGFGHTGYVQTAVCLTALPLFFLTKKKDYPAFFLLFANGLVFSLVYSYSSNGYLYVLAMGHFTASIAGFLFFTDFAGECKTETGVVSTRLLPLLCGLMLCLATLETAVLRITNVYRDAPLSALTETITEGPAKGLHTTPVHNTQYREVYETLQKYCLSGPEDGADVLLISKLLPWGYLCTDMTVGAPTTWRNELGSDRLKEYYALNPDRIPDKVLVLREEYGSYDTCGDVEADPTPNAPEKPEGWFTDYMAEQGYRKTEVPCGTVYIRRADPPAK